MAKAKVFKHFNKISKLRKHFDQEKIYSLLFGKYIY